MHHINQIYINGEFVTPHGTQTLDLIHPVTGKVASQVILADEVDTQNAIAAAKNAFKTFRHSTKADALPIYAVCTKCLPNTKPSWPM